MKLIEAVQLGMMIGEMKDLDKNITVYVRDFLAVKFTNATFGIKNEDELKMLRNLWFEITGESL